MVRLFIVLCVIAVTFLARQVPAEACGLKVASSAPRTRKLTPQSQHPSKILLLGDVSRRTASAIYEAGHSVEVAADAGSVRGQRYHLIVADGEKVAEARESWPGVIVVSSRGTSLDVLQQVEAELDRSPKHELVARLPIRTSAERRPIATSPRTDARSDQVASGGGDVSGDASSETRTPIAAGGGASDDAQAAASGGGTSDDGADAASGGAKADGAGNAAGSSEPDPATATASIDTSESRTRERDAIERPRASVGHGRHSAHFVTHIYFGHGSSDLTDQFRASLVRDARWLTRNPRKKVTIQGHANAIGVASANKALSQARSDAVKDFLLEQGVDASRIRTQAFGMERPEFQPGTNPKNRRAVIVINR